MDAFEQLAADIFWNEGCWVRTGVKVELTKEEKVHIGRHSAPRCLGCGFEDDDHAAVLCAIFGRIARRHRLRIGGPFA